MFPLHHRPTIELHTIFRVPKRSPQRADLLLETATILSAQVWEADEKRAEMSC